MTIGILHLDFLIPGARSLKDKRRVVKSLKDRLRHRFNCSVSETEFEDIWGRARITVCVVSNERQHVNTQLNEIARYAALNSEMEFLDFSIEML
jgi:hypothetical protein